MFRYCFISTYRVLEKFRVYNRFRDCFSSKKFKIFVKILNRHKLPKIESQENRIQYLRSFDRWVRNFNLSRALSSLFLRLVIIVPEGSVGWTPDQRDSSNNILEDDIFISRFPIITTIYVYILTCYIMFVFRIGVRNNFSGIGPVRFDEFE